MECEFHQIHFYNGIKIKPSGLSKDRFRHVFISINLAELNSQQFKVSENNSREKLCTHSNSLSEIIDLKCSTMTQVFYFYQRRRDVNFTGGNLSSTVLISRIKSSMNKTRELLDLWQHLYQKKFEKDFQLLWRHVFSTHVLRVNVVQSRPCEDNRFKTSQPILLKKIGHDEIFSKQIFELDYSQWFLH